jgi:hypothetical protein
MEAWLWAGAALIGAGAVFWFARSSFRSGVRQAFFDELRRAYPEAKLVEDREDRMVLRSSSFGEVVVRLGNLYVECARSGRGGQEAVIRKFLAGLHERAADLGPLSLDRHGSRLLPRVVPSGFLEGNPFPQRPLGETGLAVVYVLDAPHSVAYLTREQLAELGIGETELHERAMKNLEAIFSPAAVWKAAAGNVVAVQTGDSHDATRLLLVPEHLPSGGEVAALVPDSDTLVLAPVPRDGDWKELAKCCVPGSGKPVLPGAPLRVTREGIARAPGF